MSTCLECGCNKFPCCIPMSNRSSFCAVLLQSRCFGVADENGENVMEDVAPMAFLPNGSISGHFIQLPQSIFYGLHGTGTILFLSIIQRWHEDVMGMLEEKHVKCKVSISFECETLKADEAAEDHIKKFMPKLDGMDAVVNIRKMRIVGLDFEAETQHEHIEKNM